MNLFGILKMVLVSIITDRAAQAGTTTSGVSIFAGIESQKFAGVESWIATYAAFIGALTATATLVYIILKIVRLLKNPNAKE